MPIENDLIILNEVLLIRIFLDMFKHFQRVIDIFKHFWLSFELFCLFKSFVSVFVVHYCCHLISWVSILVL